MPFQSEKQKRYLWANEPEIAREWTDRYGANQGGLTRTRFFTGAQKDTASGKSMSPGTSASGGTRGHGGGHHGGGDHRRPTTYTKPKTKTFTGPSRGDGIGSQTFNKNLRTLQKQQQYQQGAYQRAHPFLSKIKSGLGSLGRGIGHVARNFNPVSLALDNPLMKLLMSGYGQGNIRNLLQRNNQNINWNDPDEEEDIAWENVNYNPNALTRLEQENLSGINHPDILSEDKSFDSYFDDRNLMAKVTGPALIQMRNLEKKQGMEAFGGTSLNENELNQLKQLKEMDADQENIYSNIVV